VPQIKEVPQIKATGRQVPKLKGTAKAPRRQVPEFLGALAPWRLLLWVPGGSLNKSASTIKDTC
jgi:hypothetical protein